MMLGNVCDPKPIILDFGYARLFKSIQPKPTSILKPTISENLKYQKLWKRRVPFLSRWNADS